MPRALPLSHSTLQVPPNAVQLLYCLRSHSCQTFKDACHQFFHLWHKLQQLREWVTQLDSYTHQHFCATPELHQYKPRLAEEYLTARPENLDGKQLDETVPLMLGIPSQGCFPFQLLQLFCRCQANLVFGDLYPLQGWLDDTEMRCHCACFQSSASGVPTPTKITFWIPLTAQSHSMNLNEWQTELVLQHLIYDNICTSIRVHPFVLDFAPAILLILILFCVHCVQVSLFPTVELQFGSGSIGISTHDGMIRAATNNQQRSWGLCQKHGALLPLNTNKWCNQVLIPTYHVFPTCKPNTKKSNSKVKTEPSEASKPFKLDQHTVVCSHISRYLAPHAIRLWKQTISHENCRPCCTVHFAGGEPVSATSLVRAPLKHLGLPARILFSTSSKSKQSGLHCGWKILPWSWTFFCVSLVPSMLKR